MKIELIKLKFNDTHSYKYKLFTHCCDEIQNDKAIIFTGEDLVHSDDCWGDERYIPRFCTSHTEVITSYEDEWEQTDNYPIQFCPHCGEKIEISVVDEIDMSDKYEELTKQHDETWNNMDSLYAKIKKLSVNDYLKLYHMINNDIAGNCSIITTVLPSHVGINGNW